MTGGVLSPILTFHDDEVTQGYFSRIGHCHAGVDIAKFCRFVRLNARDVTDGNESFIDFVAEITGHGRALLAHNALRRLSDDRFKLRGETLDVKVLRRTTVRFCPYCCADDRLTSDWLGQGAETLRWAWHLRPVVTCAVHHVELVELLEPDALKGLDLSLVMARNDRALLDRPAPAHLELGPLQAYVVGRMNGRTGQAPWLDSQSILQAVKACQMLGSLIAEGPTAEIRRHTDTDWARLGDMGYQICGLGPEAIVETLMDIRRRSGRVSGRTGPQAVYGTLYRWFTKAPKSAEAGPLRDLLRDAILNSFAIGPGETVLGEPVERRLVHSVNSLRAATGLNPKRLYALMQKAGMIPEGGDAESLNQWVFPAEEGERLIARVMNSVPQNQLEQLLGCTVTHVGRILEEGLVTSVVPIAEGRVGLTVGAYNRDEMADFVARLCAEVPVVAEAPEGFMDLTLAARRRFIVGKILSWQLDGSLKRTLRISDNHRIDGLRFCHDEVCNVLRARSPANLVSIVAASRELGVDRKTVRMLVSGEAPLLVPAPADDLWKRLGGVHVSRDEIARFRDDHIKITAAARMLGLSLSAAKAFLDAHVAPIMDRKTLGTRIYRRADIMALLVCDGVLRTELVVDAPASRESGAKNAKNSPDRAKPGRKTVSAGSYASDL